MKINIAGTEYSVLCGMPHMIENVRLIYVKICPRKLEQWTDSRVDVKKLLRRREFNFVQLFDGRSLIVRGIWTE